MKIVIPMSGFGERFRNQGFTVPKPLIEIDGKPMIGHVLDMFPGEHDFILICNEDHLAEPKFQMREILQNLAPSGTIVGIPPHKLGPVNAVLSAELLLDPSEPVVVNYCDFTCYWDWNHFLKFVTEVDCSGVVPAYRGFHPHSLGTTNYAYMRESNGWLLDIQEKKPFTSHRMDEFASSGTYYFRTSSLMLSSFRKMISRAMSVGQEYYVSLAYKVLLEEGHAIGVYPLQHFVQWGTPEDLQEYRMWSRAFEALGSQQRSNEALKRRGTVVLPLAGRGERFAKEGYSLAKPMIEVSGQHMVVQAARDLPPANEYIFVSRKDLGFSSELGPTIREMFPSVRIIDLDYVTDGQATTAFIGIEDAVKSLGHLKGPITVGATDNGVIVEWKQYFALINDPGVDVIVWGTRYLPNAMRNPHMYGWISSTNGIVESISVKELPKDHDDLAVTIGTFSFRDSAKFLDSYERLVARDGRVNGEFYVDSLVNDAVELGMDVRLLEVESYLNWGTPNDLKTFNYWQSFFSKWPQHPYTIEGDSRVPKARAGNLVRQYAHVAPALPTVSP